MYTDVCFYKILLLAECFAFEGVGLLSNSIAYEGEIVCTIKNVSLSLPAIPWRPELMMFYLPSVTWSENLDL